MNAGDEAVYQVPGKCHDSVADRQWHDDDKGQFEQLDIELLINYCLCYILEWRIWSKNK